MNNKNEVKKGAKLNLKTTKLKDFKFDDADLSVLNNWTYIGNFLYEAERSLSLSEKFNEKKEFTEMDELILAHGMFKNCVLSYAKCFSQSGSGKISLDGNTIFNSDPSLKIVHEKIMELRNKYVAHNGLSDMDVSLIATTERDGDIILAQTYTVLTPISEFGEFRKAIVHAEKWVIETFNKKVDKIQERLGKTIRFE